MISAPLYAMDGVLLNNEKDYFHMMTVRTVKEEGLYRRQVWEIDQCLVRDVTSPEF